MDKSSPTLLSLIIPAYNEADGLPDFHASLLHILNDLDMPHEVLYVDDGSTDTTARIVEAWHTDDKSIKLVKLSRNFGKEAAMTAGISSAKGDAIMLLDADGQHPVQLIPQFVKAWQAGAQVVIGVRQDSEGIDSFKRLGSKYFYQLFNRMSQQPLIPGSTDFRLISREVADALLSLPENDRITRGLIDWLGFKREFIRFTAPPRLHGAATYNRRKLMQLATNSFVSLTSAPIYLFGYIGIFITIVSFIVGFLVFIEQLVLDDPLYWNFTGTAMLGILLIFLVGVVLLSQGILALYISHIHTQSKGRPLYVIDFHHSHGFDNHRSNHHG